MAGSEPFPGISSFNFSQRSYEVGTAIWTVLYIISRVFLFSSGKYAEGELLDLINVLFSVLGRGGACHIILHSGHSKFQFQQRCLRVPFLHIPTNPHYFSLFYDNRSNRCEVISQFAVDLHFPEDEWC